MGFRIPFREIGASIWKTTIDAGSVTQPERGRTIVVCRRVIRSFCYIHGSGIRIIECVLQIGKGICPGGAVFASPGRRIHIEIPPVGIAACIGITAYDMECFCIQLTIVAVPVRIIKRYRMVSGIIAVKGGWRKVDRHIAAVTAVIGCRKIGGSKRYGAVIHINPPRLVRIKRIGRCFRDCNRFKRVDNLNHDQCRRRITCCIGNGKLYRNILSCHRAVEVGNGLPGNRCCYGSNGVIVPKAVDLHYIRLHGFRQGNSRNIAKRSISVSKVNGHAADVNLRLFCILNGAVHDIATLWIIGLRT